MQYNGQIVASSGVEVTEVPAEAAEFLAESYEALAKLPVNRQVTVDFAGEGTKKGKETQAEADAREARLFVRQGKSWAAQQSVKREDGSETTLVFARKGDIKGAPTRVSFRVYIPRPEKEETEATKA